MIFSDITTFLDPAPTGDSRENEIVFLAATWSEKELSGAPKWI